MVIKSIIELGIKRYLKIPFKPLPYLLLKGDMKPLIRYSITKITTILFSNVLVIFSAIEPGVNSVQITTKTKEKGAITGYKEKGPITPY